MGQVLRFPIERCRAPVHTAACSEDRSASIVILPVARIECQDALIDRFALEAQYSW